MKRIHLAGANLLLLSWLLLGCAPRPGNDATPTSPATPSPAQDIPTVAPTATPNPCAGWPGRDTRPRTFLALGDSYTIGEGVSEAERWPVQLVEKLRQDGIPMAEPTIVAATGWTTSQLRSRLNQLTTLRPSYDLVTLLIGVNNQFRGGNETSYQTEFNSLLRHALQLAGSRQRVLVLSIPDYSVTPFAAARSRDGRYQRETSQAIDRFNTINRAEAARYGVTYIDITPLSRQAAGNAALLAADGLHPAGTMYAQWVTLIQPAACQALRATE